MENYKGIKRMKVHTTTPATADQILTIIPKSYRNKLIEKWKKILNRKGIKSENCQK